MKLSQLIMPKGIKNSKGNSKSKKQKNMAKDGFCNLLCVNIESLFKNTKNKAKEDIKNSILNSKSKKKEKKIFLSPELAANLFIYANKEGNNLVFSQDKIVKLEKEINALIKSFKKGIKGCSKESFVFNFSKKLKSVIKKIFKDAIKNGNVNFKGLDRQKIMLDPNISSKIDKLAKNIYKNLDRLESLGQIIDLKLDDLGLQPKEKAKNKITESVKDFLLDINKVSQNNGNKKVLLNKNGSLKGEIKNEESQKNIFPKKEIKLDMPAEEKFKMGNVTGRLNPSQPSKISKLEQAIFKVLNRQDIQNKPKFREEITVKLEPESLGEVKINISSNKEQVNLIIKTNLFHTIEILKENIALLKNNLSNKGLEMNQVVIEVDSKMGSKKGREEFNNSFSRPKQMYNNSNFSLDEFDLSIGNEYQIRPDLASKNSHYLNLLI